MVLLPGRMQGEGPVTRNGISRMTDEKIETAILALVDAVQEVCDALAEVDELLATQLHSKLGFVASSLKDAVEAVSDD